MLITSQFVKDKTRGPFSTILVETYKAGKRGLDAFKKIYHVNPEFFTDDILIELAGDTFYYGPTGKTHGVRIWFDGDSYINFYVTKKTREKIDKKIYEFANTLPD